MMSRSALVTAVLLIVALPAQALPAPLADVTLKDGRLGFCGVSLGDPVAPGTEEFDGAHVDFNLCGRFVPVRFVSVRYAMRAGEPAVDMIWIARRDADAAAVWGLAAMRSGLAAALPGAAYFESEYEPGMAEVNDTSPQYYVAGADEQVIVLKPDEAIYMAYGDGND